MSQINSGEIKINIKKLIHPYMIYINNVKYMDNITTEGDIIISGLTSKYYSIKIIDGNNDSVVKNIFLPRNSGVLYAYNFINASSNGVHDASITITNIENENSLADKYTCYLYQWIENLGEYEYVLIDTYEDIDGSGLNISGITNDYYKIIVSEQNCGNNYKEVNISILIDPIVTETYTPISDGVNVNSGGVVVNMDRIRIIEHGACWSTGETPTINNNRTSQGVLTSDTFVSAINGMAGNITYYVSAYVETENNVIYGPIKSILLKIPTITTNTTTLITTTGATSGGNITTDGGLPVTDRGICWSATPSPTIYNTILEDGNGGIGSYTLNITGLTSGFVYYVKAWAINEQGITYGNEVIFSTL